MAPPWFRWSTAKAWPPKRTHWEKCRNSIRLFCLNQKRLAFLRTGGSSFETLFFLNSLHLQALQLVERFLSSKRIHIHPISHRKGNLKFILKNTFSLGICYFAGECSPLVPQAPQLANSSITSEDSKAWKTDRIQKLGSWVFSSNSWALRHYIPTRNTQPPKENCSSVPGIFRTQAVISKESTAMGKAGKLSAGAMVD